MREIWKLLLFRTLWFVIQLSFKIFQALTSFALLYQYTDPSGKFGKHSKTFRDHVNFPVAITKQHNWQPISYVAQTKHTNFIFSKVNPNALKNQAIRSYTATTATDTSSLVSYAQKEEGVCEVLCNISNKDFFWTEKNSVHTTSILNYFRPTDGWRILKIRRKLPTTFLNAYFNVSP